MRSNSDILILRDRAAFPANIRRRFRTVHFLRIHRPHAAADNGFTVPSSQMMLTLVCSLKSLIEFATIADLAGNKWGAEGFFITVYPSMPVNVSRLTVTGCI
ncbi:Uncharacterised protein [Yersinia ruckeri]|uniref:Uncharacterized protein n=1 Tax=Yersinia ruckeri TaxID=29486 RepID=A0A380QJC6_YERRU|nr:Uncharacterised protein [Yersinia ruckeri]